MIRRKFIVDIGIPAFNEGRNLGDLINSLLTQTETFFCTGSVIVLSDGSSDNTIEVVQQIKDKRLRLVLNKRRMGLAYSQNRLFSLATGNAIVLLQGDIRVSDPFFISKLSRPIMNGADLVSGEIEELAPKSFTSRVVQAGMEYKRKVFNRYKDGNNFFTCHGPVRGFSRSLYKKIRFNQDQGEDLYSYLFCRSQGFKYHFVPRAKVAYRLPEKLGEHAEQSNRFFSALRKMENEFGTSLTEKELSLPLGLLAQEGLKFLMRSPFMAISYGFVTMIALFYSKSGKKHNNADDKWVIATSSKFLT